MGTLMALACVSATAQKTLVQQMEQLDRGVVVMPVQSGSGRFISWRLLGTDTKNTTFDVLRNNSVIASGLSSKTNFQDTGGKATDAYTIVTRQDGNETERSTAAHSWADIYTSVQLDRPAGGTTSSGDYTYTPNDMSVGDVDGDGEYELFVKWDPSNSSDNAGGSFTGDCIIDCYKLSGQKLWRVNLGKNIRSGAHYTQFLVYDFNGDGRAEMICKTAPGSLDGQGNYVTAAATESTIKGASNTADYRNTKGMVLSGPEYLTVFNGQTGKAIHTIWYNPNRAGGYGTAADYPSSTSFWGDNSGNRGDRFLAAVAHLDKGARTASAVMVRGYYTRAYLWAVDFDGQTLKQRWLHTSDSKTTYSLTDGSGKTTNYSGLKPTNGGDGNSSASGTMYGNGNHNLSVADVDGDGCDEILFGSAACDHNGRLLYGVGYGHGDAMHLSDLLPDRPGLEVFDVHEEKKDIAWDIHDARTGQVLLKGGPEGADNGRGLAAQVDPDVRAFYFSSSADNQTRSCLTGNVVSEYGPTVNNFRIYWDGDLQDELLGDISRHNSPFLEKWNGNGYTRMYPKRNTNLYQIANSMTCNDTKGTPCLQADILGDWREEIIFYDGSDPSKINIFSTNMLSDYRLPTLMHDHVYRMGIAWQNVSYNQPPHLGFYLPDYFNQPDTPEPGEEESSIVVVSQDYETETDASTWSFAQSSVKRGDLTLGNVDDEQGNYVQYSVGGNNSTAVYSLVSSDTYDTYTLEFDAAFKSGTKDASQFVVMAENGKPNVPSSSPHWFSYASYNENLQSLLFLTIPANGSAAKVNYDDTDETAVADGNWYHYVLKVDGTKRTVDYAIALKATGGEVKSGSYLVPDGTESLRLKGFYYLAGRYNSNLKIDNIKVSVSSTTTAITNVKAGERTGVAYSLSGQRVEAKRPGLYIIDGRKVIVR